MRLTKSRTETIWSNCSLYMFLIQGLLSSNHQKGRPSAECASDCGGAHLGSNQIITGHTWFMANKILLPKTRAHSIQQYSSFRWMPNHETHQYQRELMFYGPLRWIKTWAPSHVQKHLELTVWWAQQSAEGFPIIKLRQFVTSNSRSISIHIRTLLLV